MGEYQAAIVYFEDAIRESDEIIEDCSPNLKAELIEQKEHFVEALDAMRAQAEDEKPPVAQCEYKLHYPREEGYSDGHDRWFLCSNCNETWISIKEALEWSHCPYCGFEIVCKETLLCRDCVYAEWDGDYHFCESEKGTHAYMSVDDADFEGCDQCEVRHNDRPPESEVL